MEKEKRLRPRVEKPSIPGQPAVQHSIFRLRNLLAAGGFITVAALAVQGLRKDDHPSDKVSKTSIHPSFSSAKSSSDLNDFQPEDIDLSEAATHFPDAKRIQKPTRYKPVAFIPNLSAGKIDEISAKFAAFLPSYFARNIYPILNESKGDTAIIQSAMARLLDDAVGFLANEDGQIPDPVYGKGEMPDFKNAVVLLNHFLLNQGLMLEDQGYVNFPFVNLISVRIEGIEISDSQNGQVTTVPLIITGKPLAGEMKVPGKYRQKPFEYAPELGSVIWRFDFEKALLSNAPEARRVLTLLPQMKSLDQLLTEENFLPAIKHEALHHYLLTLFPADKDRRGDASRDFVNVVAHLGADKDFKVEGYFHPLSFHELACRGMDLISIDEKNVDTTKLSFAAFFAESPDYVYDLQRAFLMKAFEESGKDPMNVALASSPEKLRAVGQQMYTLGRFLLEKRKVITR